MDTYKAQDAISEAMFESVKFRIDWIIEMYDLGQINEEQKEEALQREYDQLIRINRYCLYKLKASEEDAS